ncbi:MAG: L-aspartate oxidase [Eubacteriales bacterium]
MDKTYDVLIVGTGVSGLYSALHLDPHLKILLISKGSLDENNTSLAQGGISTALGQKDIKPFIKDTMLAGQNYNHLPAVEILAKESISTIQHLIELGMPFDKEGDGTLSYTKEGAHSINRIVHVKDETGKFLWKTLMREVRKRNNITIIESMTFIDVMEKNNSCYGGILLTLQDDSLQFVYAKCILLATGGIGGIFKNSTNHKALTGDALSIAMKHHIEIKDLELIQIHPTGLYDNNYYGRRFLISESVRGEGGILVNERGERFINELLPRDVVTRAITEEIHQSKLPYVFLDISFLDKEFIQKRFPLIYAKCAQIGIDISKDPMLVIPSQHYHMGGIQVDLDSKTSMKNLYAVGEVSCTGIHGKNRLASNSLLEGLVFSKRAALSINKEIKKINIQTDFYDAKLPHIKSIQKTYKKLLISEIKRRYPAFHDELFDYR